MPNSKEATEKHAHSTAAISNPTPVEAVKADHGTSSANKFDGALDRLWASTKRLALSDGRVSRDDVAWCYRNMLGREPESEAVIDTHIHLSTFRELVAEFLKSQEFLAKTSGINLRGSGSGNGYMPLMLDRLQIAVNASQDELGQCAAKIKTTWEHLGQEKAHFSVVTDELFLPQNLDRSIDSFWTSGETDASIALRTLEQYGLSRLEEMTCVEYGCGVGRVTVNLAKSFGKVHAYDISRNHLQHARARAHELGRSNIEFHECSHDFRVAIRPCDFFYSVIVLQHNPPPVIMELIRIALTALKPGGIAIFQVPTYIIGYRFDLNEWLTTDFALDMQMHCVPQDVVLDAISGTGCRLLGLREDGCTAAPDHMISNTFFCRKQ